MLEIEAEILQIREQFVLYRLDVCDNDLFWLFDIREGPCFKLNETTFFILSCFDGKTPNSEILYRLISRYTDVDHEKIYKDFMDIVKTLKRENILCLAYTNNRGE